MKTVSGSAPQPHSTAGDDPARGVETQRHGPATPSVVDCGVYVDGHRRPGGYSPEAAWAHVHERGEGFVWIGLHEPDTHQMHEVAEIFGLHRLAVEEPYTLINDRKSNATTTPCHSSSRR